MVPLLVVEEASIQREVSHDWTVSHVHWKSQKNILNRTAEQKNNQVQL